MAFTYAASAVASNTTMQIRLELGDTTSSGSVFDDSELEYFYSAESSSVQKAAARALETLARKMARNPTAFTADGLNIQLSPSECLAQAKELRKVANSGGAGNAVIHMRRYDGYSSDVVAGS